MDLKERATTWVDRYVLAWNSNEPADIEALFTPTASYSPAPYSQPWPGRDAIVREWLSRADQPGKTHFDWRVVATDGDLAVVHGTTQYPDRAYSNLWLVRLDDDGRCTEFAEWWMQHPRRRRT
jgi:SnoaL-like domain